MACEAFCICEAMIAKDPESSVVHGPGRAVPLLPIARWTRLFVSVKVSVEEAGERSWFIARREWLIVGGKLRGRESC